ncbi:MAG: hypothetical protein IKC46_00730 [Lachnospiraceae bacterium]|nr:hypothetical protein [Lachnospiraceae bacterium]
MKACIIQPPYSADYEKSEECFELQLSLMDQCDSSMDLIVLPECCDIPSLARTSKQRLDSIHRYNRIILDKAAETARRCSAMVFVNARYDSGNGLINTTYAFDRNGNVAGKYFKQHPTAGEVNMPEADTAYAFTHSEPTVLEMEGLRFGFLTCYDFYFYEAFPTLARQNLDIIIGCSHQRSDTHDALEIITRFLAYHTNTYVVRSSVSMEEASRIGGASMIVAPTGSILAHLYSKVGLACADFDPKEKYYKPAGYGNPPAAHHEYIEIGRRPWKYRPAGSAIVCPDRWMTYPRTCSHRGFHAIAPENSLPAFGAAIAMGADEIEFDIWPTKDGQIVSLHDATLDRVYGTGNVYEHTYEELLRLDFGCKYGEAFKGMKILTFEEILKKFACQTIMNIHVKTVDNTCEYDRAILEKIIALIYKYDCQDHVYFMSGNDNFLRLAKEAAPQIPRCVGGGNDPWGMVERAIKYGCCKIQLFKPYFDQQMIDKAHAHGIRCNVFWSDDPKETVSFLDMGIDTILTNDYNRISQEVSAWKQKN